MDITNKINGINKNINETFENFFYDSIDDHFVIDKIPIYKSKKNRLWESS